MKTVSSSAFEIDSSRIQFLDFFRGILVGAMLIFHINYFGREIFQTPYLFSRGIFEELFQMFVGGGFLLIAGYCSLRFPFSFSSWRKRFFQLFFAAVIISGVTILFFPDFPIHFGILHCFALLALGEFFFPTQKQKNLFLAILLFFLAFFFPISTNSNNWFLLPFGFLPLQYYAVDYYPIIPWAHMYFFGRYLSHFSLPIENFFSKTFFNKNYSGMRIMNFFGKNSFWIYCLHVPIIFLLFKICDSINF